MTDVVFSRGQRAGQHMVFTGHDAAKRCTFRVALDALQRLDGSAADDFDAVEALGRHWIRVTEAAERCFAAADDGAQVDLDYRMLLASVDSGS